MSDHLIDMYQDSQETSDSVGNADVPAVQLSGSITRAENQAKADANRIAMLERRIQELVARMNRIESQLRGSQNAMRMVEQYLRAMNEERDKKVGYE